MAAVIANIETANISTKKAVSEAVSTELKTAGYDAALCRLIEWHFAEFSRRTLNNIENGSNNFISAIKPELIAWGKGYFSEAAMRKAEKPASSASSASGKSGKIDNSLFCGMLKALMGKAPSEGGYAEKDLPVLQKLHDALSPNKYSVARILEASQAKIDNAPDAKAKKAAQHEHELRSAVITLIESELERLAKEAKNNADNEVLALL